MSLSHPFAHPTAFLLNLSGTSSKDARARCVKSACLVALLGSVLGHIGCAKEARASGPEHEPAQAFERRGNELVVPERSPLRARLVVVPVSTQPVRQVLEVPATAEADPAKITKISPPLPGRVVKLMVRLGDPVREGAPIYALDSADLAAAQSDYLKASSTAAQAARALSRQRDLSEHGIGSQKDLEQAQTDHEQATSEMARASTRLKLLGMDPGEMGRPLTVRAPITGRVVDLATAPGQYQNDPAAVLMVIADLSTIWVTAQVPEKDIGRVNVGDSASVDFGAYPGESWEGRVHFVGDVLAPETRTVKVRIELANEGHRLKPGMFARVTLRGPEAPGLVVPASALLVREDRSYLFVEKTPWVFERRPVEVGEALAQGVQVIRGLRPGERIVTADTILFP
jgi:membrane fusion protein, heavy metal efflux system